MSILMIGSSIITIAPLAVLQAFIRGVASPVGVSGLPSWFGLDDLDRQTTLYVLTAVLVLATLVQAGYQLGMQYLMLRVSANVFSTTSTRVFQKYMEAPYLRMLSTKSSELVRNLTFDTLRVSVTLMNSTMVFAMNLFIMTGVIGYLVYSYLTSSLPALVMVVLLSMILCIFGGVRILQRFIVRENNRLRTSPADAPSLTN